MPRLGIYPAQMLLVEKELQAIVLNYRREVFLLFHKQSVSMNLSWTTYNSFTIYPSFINSNLSINPLVTYTFLSSSTNTASASYFSKRSIFFVSFNRLLPTNLLFHQTYQNTLRYKKVLQTKSVIGYISHHFPAVPARHPSLRYHLYCQN